VSEPATPPDAVGRALGALDHLLDQFHDRVLRPLLLIGRTVAFGFVLLLAALVVVVMVLVAAVRLLDVYAFDGRTWATYLLLGGLLSVLGMLVWRWRRPVRLRS
jgi:hypothetical protein